MKPRRWILAAFLVVLFFLGGLYLGNYFLQKNRNLERLLVRNLSPFVPGSFDIDKIHIGFFSINLSKINIDIPLSSVALYIEKIKIGFSFSKLFSSKGDIKKSINKVIIVSPIINISFPEIGDSSFQNFSYRKIVSMDAFPVKYIEIKNSLINLLDHNHNKTVIGEALHGKVWEENMNLNFDLEGKLAAGKKNLFISGVLSEDKSSQHISLRLDKARIKKAIQWKNFTIKNGTLDGVCELSFSDTTFPHNIEAHGKISIRNCVGKLKDLAGNITIPDWCMNFKGNQMVFDSVHAQYKKSNLFFYGRTGFSAQQEKKFFLRLSDLNPRMFSELPELVDRTVAGSGWFEIYAVKKENKEKFVGDFSLGGLTINQEPIKYLRGKCRFNGKNVTLDTASLKYADFSVEMKGIVNYEKAPVVYSFTFNTTSKAQYFFPQSKGELILRGTLRGLGNKPLGTIKVEGTDLFIYDYPLGSPKISFSYNGQSIKVNCPVQDNALISFSGSITELDKKLPQIALKINGKKEFLGYLLERHVVEPFILLKNAEFTVNINGNLKKPEITGQFRYRGSDFWGLARFNAVQKKKSTTYEWTAYDDSLTYNGIHFPLYTAGSLHLDTLLIDSFNLKQTLSGKGRVILGEKSNIDVNLDCHDLLVGSIGSVFRQPDLYSIQGIINGNANISGPLTRPKTRMRLNISDASIAEISDLETDMIIILSGKDFTVLPFVIRKNDDVILMVDTVTSYNQLSFAGKFNDLETSTFIPINKQEDFPLDGTVSGVFSKAPDDSLIQVKLFAPKIKVSSFTLDSLSSSLTISPKNLRIVSLNACDSSLSRIKGEGTIPWSFIQNNNDDNDTLLIRVSAHGDLLGTLTQNLPSPVYGHGQGVLLFDFYKTSEQWHFNQAHTRIINGTMVVHPFIPDTIKNVDIKLSLNDSSKLTLDCRGIINKRSLIMTSSHSIPSGFEPLVFGPVNCGIVYITTPQKGIHLFLPGFMEPGNVGDFEFAPKEPFDFFALSGPVDRFRITGTWIIRSAEFTFPFIEEQPPPEDDPFPYVTWDLDLKAGNRKVVYFYNIGGKRRKYLRFVECTLDPSAYMTIKGRDRDGTYRLLGSLRSYKGSVFYGKNFDRNFRLGLDFSPEKIPGQKGYNNLPIIWGSAEAFSDSSRFSRIKLVLLTRDSVTGIVKEKGRFHDISFRVSSNFEGKPVASEKKFYHDAGIRFFTLKDAGEVVSNFGDNYIKNYFLQKIERKLAKRLGLDVITFETSIAANYFNYFYNQQREFEDFTKQWNILTFANVGITIGRYFLQDKVFVKWRTEFVPKELLLSPEHSVGFEYQPIEYFWVDFNYLFYRNNNVLEYNPRLRMQLRIPITINKIKDFYKF